MFVSGIVQGVGFRYATVRAANPLGVTGWVRNTHDDRVEICAEGSPESLDKLIEWCRRGPSLARVRDVQIVSRHSVDQGHFDSFEIRP